MSRGSAVVESLVLGTIGVAIVLAVILGAVRIQAAGDRAEQTARVTANAIARWGGSAEAAEVGRTHAPDAEVVVERSGDRIVVTVRIVVPLVGPAGSPVSTTVTGRAEARIAPYRSAR
jgi:hypothetical protein